MKSTLVFATVFGFVALTPMGCSSGGSSDPTGSTGEAIKGGVDAGHGRHLVEAGRPSLEAGPRAHPEGGDDDGGDDDGGDDTNEADD